ncbi:MAG: TraR/DksA C4-type zinc finger protein [Candidatus Marinimicrobia bacterium]|nr:TraR/DksA C4-type zinc finger protein [Candidatus Neomarinimicrobiota bacterium]
MKGTAVGNKYNKTQLKKFRAAILEKMEGIVADVDDIKDGIRGTGEATRGASPDSVYSVHMADAGTDSHEREKNYLLMNREGDYYKNLRIALDRIDTGEFGICIICEGLIPEERLFEVPNATKCVGCKEKDKLNLI